MREFGNETRRNLEQVESYEFKINGEKMCREELSRTRLNKELLDNERGSIEQVKNVCWLSCELVPRKRIIRESDELIVHRKSFNNRSNVDLEQVKNNKNVHLGGSRMSV